MWLIVALLIIAALLIVAEMVLIPGFSVAGVCALVADAAAVWIAFARYGSSGGFAALGVAVAVAIISVVLALRAKTWERFSLKDNIGGTSMPVPENSVAIGDRGVAITRLAPMGKVRLGGETFEAKGIDAYIDQGSGVEVTGFDNFNVIVKKINL